MKKIQSKSVSAIVWLVPIAIRVGSYLLDVLITRWLKKLSSGIKAVWSGRQKFES